MAFSKEARTGPYGAPTPSQLEDTNARASRAYAKALRRYQIAKAVGRHRGSLREKVEWVEMLMDQGFIRPGALPSRSTVKALAAFWAAGHQALEDYFDKPRAGRPRKHLPSAFEAQIQNAIRAADGRTAKQLRDDLQAWAASRGIQAPTYYAVHARFARAGRLVRSTARHGSRAGEFDGLPHPRFVSRHCHEVWAIDEYRSPVWIRQLDENNRWVSARPSVILIVDICSGAIVGYFVSDPSTRISEEGLTFRTGFNANDVMCALLSACVPELGTDATRAFAGYLPTRIRWDNAQAHKTVAALLKAAMVPIEVTPIRKRRAISNAHAERRVGVMKARTAGMHGHVDLYIPTDAIAESAADLGVERSHATTSSNDREARKIPIRPEDLPSREEFLARFDLIVAAHNYEHVNRMNRLTPAAKFMRDLEARRPRDGQTLLRALDPHTCVVTGDGITHTHLGVQQRFYPLIEGALLLLDTAVTYLADPGGRGIFVSWGGKLHYMQQQYEWCDSDSAEVARNANAITRKLSDEADARRRAGLESVAGPGAVQAAQDQYDHILRQAGTPPHPAEDVLIQPDPESEAKFRAQWAMRDPEQFVSGSDLGEVE